MKPILAISGMVAVEVPADEIVPENGLLQRHLVQYVGDLYNFSIRPQIANMPPEMTPILPFQQGEFAGKQGVIPIQQLVIFPNGDAVAAADTDLAEEIIEDYLNNLDNYLGYRNKDKVGKRFYASTVVVDFDRPLEDAISTFKKMTEFISREIPRTQPFDLKSLSFGAETGAITFTAPEVLLQTDFSIQRRVGAPHNHRYFCTAPMRTSDHYRVLEEIERILG